MQDQRRGGTEDVSVVIDWRSSWIRLMSCSDEVAAAGYGRGYRSGACE